MDNPASNLGSGNRGTLVNLVALDTNERSDECSWNYTNLEVPGSNPGGSICVGP
jgi:hypothetical protein